MKLHGPYEIHLAAQFDLDVIGRGAGDGSEKCVDAARCGPANARLSTRAGRRDGADRAAKRRGCPGDEFLPFMTGAACALRRGGFITCPCVINY
jgi:hypothetical protein